MTPEELDTLATSLPVLLAVSVPLLGLILVLHRSRFPGLSFRRSGIQAEPPLWGWPEILVVLGTWYLAQIGMGAVLATTVQDGTLKLAVATVVVHAGAGVVTGLVILRLIRGNLGQPLRSLGLTGTSWANVLPTLLLLVLMLQPLVSAHALWSLFLAEVFDIQPVIQELVTLYRDSIRDEDWVSVACLITAGTVVAPVLEEVIFRGLIFLPLRLRWGGAVGAIASSSIFAAVHWSLSAFLPLFLLGGFLCYLTARTGSLYPAMLFHLAFNSVTFLGHFWAGGF